MAMQPSAAVVPSPYYMSVGGHPMYSEHIRDRSMASFQSAMFPGLLHVTCIRPSFQCRMHVPQGL